MRRPSGYIEIDGSVVGETAMCAHCGYHWRIVRGSGRKRGFCLKCMGPTCGRKECDECVPLEKRIEMMEK